MKFTDGYWLLKKDVQAIGTVDLRDIEITNELITLYVANVKVEDRGQVLNAPILTIEVNSPSKNIIGINAFHFKGVKDRDKKFKLNQKNLELNYSETNEEIKIASGKMCLLIKRNPFSMDFYFDEKYLTGSNTKQLAYLSTPDGNYFRERLNISVGELLYGLGERFSAFVKNGQSIDVWNEDGGTASEQAYKNIPFYVSNRGYGVFVNHSENVSYEVASEAVSKAQFSVEGENLNYMVIGGENLHSVIENYTELTGKPTMPPAWSFGLWLSTSFTTKYNEETVQHFIDGMFERKIPLSVFHFDCFWMKEYEWCNFEWDEDSFPDVNGMLRRIKAKDLHICCWLNSYVGQKSKLFDIGMEKGYFLKRQNGDVWQWNLWQAGMAVVDFTNPEACNWFKNCLRKLLVQGVDCFKTDFGERIPLDVVYYDGSDPKKMHNYYTYLYNKTVFEVLEEYKGKNNAVLFQRSGTVGSQTFPVHWGGDCEANYVSMAESLRGGLSLSLAGFGFWSHDIGGFEQTATPDVYKRWVAFGLLSSHSRLHGSTSYRVPWLFDEEAVDVLRFFTNLKHKLMPYIFTTSMETTKTGIPVMRPMILEFQYDESCGYLDKQYMLGENILVAPILNKEGYSNTYIPKGKFTHLLTNKVEDGGKYIKETYDFFALPLWVKPNSIIVMGKDSSKVVYEYNENIDINLYEIEDAYKAIYNFDCVLKCEIYVKKIKNKFTIKIKGTVKNATLVFHNINLGQEFLDKTNENSIIELKDIISETELEYTIKCVEK